MELKHYWELCSFCITSDLGGKVWVTVLFSALTSFKWNTKRTPNLLKLVIKYVWNNLATAVYDTVRLDLKSTLEILWDIYFCNKATSGKFLRCGSFHLGKEMPWLTITREALWLLSSSAIPPPSSYVAHLHWPCCYTVTFHLLHSRVRQKQAP